MIDGAYNKWDHVTIDSFLEGKEYQRGPFENPIALAVGKYISAFGLDRAAVGDMQVSSFLHNTTYQGFQAGYQQTSSRQGRQGEYGIDYVIGYNMGNAVRIQEASTKK